MSYQAERDQFIASMTREGLPLWVVLTLLREATGLQRRAELACSSAAADRDRVPCPADMGSRLVPRKKTGPCLCDLPESGHTTIPRITLQDHRAELRASAALPAGWELETAGDPRGYVLRVIPPSYAARNKGRDRFNRDSIGVPARESRLRF